MAIGRLLVEVPPGVTVGLTARSGIGDVSYGNGDQSYFMNGTGPINDKQSSGRILELDAQAGIGEVQLVRAS